MTNLKNLLLTGIGVASLALTGCGDNKEIKDKSKEIHQKNNSAKVELKKDLSQDDYLNFAEYITKNGEYFEGKTKIKGDFTRGYKLELKEKDIMCESAYAEVSYKINGITRKSYVKGTIIKFGNNAIEDINSNGFKKGEEIIEKVEDVNITINDVYYIGLNYFSVNDLSTSKFNKVKAINDSLITNIPRWYEESKKQKE